MVNGHEVTHLIGRPIVGDGGSVLVVVLWIIARSPAASVTIGVALILARIWFTIRILRAREQLLIGIATVSADTLLSRQMYIPISVLDDITRGTLSHRILLLGGED